jgi:hypothetical protein
MIGMAAEMGGGGFLQRGKGLFVGQGAPVDGGFAFRASPKPMD